MDNITANVNDASYFAVISGEAIDSSACCCCCCFWSNLLLATPPDLGHRKCGLCCVYVNLFLLFRLLTAWLTDWLLRIAVVELTYITLPCLLVRKIVALSSRTPLLHAHHWSLRWVHSVLKRARKNNKVRPGVDGGSTWTVTRWKNKNNTQRSAPLCCANLNNLLFN